MCPHFPQVPKHPPPVASTSLASRRVPAPSPDDGMDQDPSRGRMSMTVSPDPTLVLATTVALFAVFVTLIVQRAIVFLQPVRNRADRCGADFTCRLVRSERRCVRARQRMRDSTLVLGWLRRLIRQMVTRSARHAERAPLSRRFSSSIDCSCSLSPRPSPRLCMWPAH